MSKIRFLFSENDTEAAGAAQKVAKSLNDGSPGMAVKLTQKEFDAMLNPNRVIFMKDVE